MTLLDSYYHLLSKAVPGTPLERSAVLYRLLHGALYRNVRKPSMGLFGPDPVLGWRNRRSVRVIHPSFEFRVSYRTDENGRRVTGYQGQKADVVLLGCSWTFGHGVADRQTFSHLLWEHEAVATHNYGCMGYGPAHGYLLLRDSGIIENACSQNGTVVYSWVPDQLIRAWRRREWIELNAWVDAGRPTHPVFDLDNGELRHGGLIGPAEGVEDPHLLPGLVERMEWRLTIRLLSEMKRTAERSGRRFTVLIPPLPAAEPEQRARTRLIELMKNARIPFLDLCDSGPGSRMFYRFDGHPTPQWHECVAERLAVLVRPSRPSGHPVSGQRPKPCTP